MRTTADPHDLAAYDAAKAAYEASGRVQHSLEDVMRELGDEPPTDAELAEAHRDLGHSAA